MKTFWEEFTTPYQMGEQKHRMFTLEYLCKLGVKSILDVGCGTGPMGEIILKHNLPFKYKGTDYSHSMIAVANGLMPELDWEVEDMRKLREKDNSWDCVLLMHSLDHTDDYKSSIKEATRVSNKYVCIILWRALKDEGTNLNSVNRMGKKDNEEPFEDTHLQEYSIQTLQEEFKKNKLELIEVINDERVNEGKSNTLFILQK